MSRRRVFTESCRGFTLLEFLVAITILALMTGIAMNSLNFSVRTSNSVESAILSTEEMHLAQRALRRQIQKAVPLPQTTQSGLNQIDFVGGNKVLEFVAPLHGAGAYAGLHRIRLEIEDDTGFDERRGRITMHYLRGPGSTEPGRADAGGRVVVIDGFAAAAFEYGSTTARGGVDWTREWRDPSRLPGLVRLRIDYPRGSERTAPDLVVAIRSTSPSRVLRRGAG